MNFLSINVPNCEKVIKIKLRIICKPYAYLQIIIKTTVKFQKNQNETVGGDAHTQGTPCPFTFIVKMTEK